MTTPYTILAQSRHRMTRLVLDETGYTLQILSVDAEVALSRAEFQAMRDAVDEALVRLLPPTRGFAG